MDSSRSSDNTRTRGYLARNRDRHSESDTRAYVVIENGETLPASAHKKSGGPKTSALGYCGENPILDLEVHVSRLVLVLGTPVLTNSQVTLVPLTLLLDPLLEVVAGTQVLPRGREDVLATTDDLGRALASNSVLMLRSLITITFFGIDLKFRFIKQFNVLACTMVDPVPSTKL